MSSLLKFILIRMCFSMGASWYIVEFAFWIRISISLSILCETIPLVFKFFNLFDREIEAISPLLRHHLYEHQTTIDLEYFYTNTVLSMPDMDTEHKP
jgi:hypothetical protein